MFHYFLNIYAPTAIYLHWPGTFKSKTKYHQDKYIRVFWNLRTIIHTQFTTQTCKTTHLFALSCLEVKWSCSFCFPTETYFYYLWKLLGFWFLLENIYEVNTCWEGEKFLLVFNILSKRFLIIPLDYFLI